MSRTDYVTNCPNCGAPITRFGHCEYCGTTIHQPIQFVTTRRGIRKLQAVSLLPVEIGERDPDAATHYAMRDMTHKMADALTEAIKFKVTKEFDPVRFQEVICVKGELWIADPEAYG